MADIAGTLQKGSQDLSRTIAIKVHYFTNLGLRTMPIGHAGVSLVRNEKGKKVVLDSEGEQLSFTDVMPSNWTNRYGQTAKKHSNTPLGGAICGVLTDKQENELEIIALDCDNEQAWNLFTLLHSTYAFRFKSVGKPGGTIVYLLSEALKTLPQYSVRNDSIEFDFMAKREGGANAMIYLPTSANKTKEALPTSAKLEYPPSQVESLLKLLQPKTAVLAPTVYEGSKANLPFNAPLVKQFVVECKDAAKKPAVFGRLEVSPLVERVYQIFTPYKFRSTKDYVDKKWLHPNSSDLLTVGPWSEYIVGVSAIAGSDPSIDAVLYTDFMQAINAQTDDPMEPKRFLEEVISPMVQQKAKVEGKPLWKYNEKWDQQSHTIVNQYGETLEYFTLESAANRFVEYNHTTKELIEIQGPKALRDQIYSKDTDSKREAPASTIVKKLKLIRVDESVKQPLGIFTDSQGHTILNIAEPTFPLRVLRDPTLYPNDASETDLHVQAFNIFISHLVNRDKDAVLFMKQVIAYHGKHLESIPVIIYMVGVGGAGKSIFAHMLEQFFGSNTTCRPSAEQVTSRFNDFLENAAVLILSETSDASPKAQEGIKSILKTVTGEKTIDIESKRVKVRRNVPIFALPVLLANEPWYQEDSEDRRLFSIMPKSGMTESVEIRAFEQLHGVKIVDFINEGIKLGVLSKYLTSFCPSRLPSVPLTQDKQQLSLEQKDPIMVVKNVVATGNWFKFFDLLEEHGATLFFTAMESPKIRDKNAIFKNQLTELVKNMRGADAFSLTDAAISKAFSPRWLPNQAQQYRPRRDNPLAMKLGYLKWTLNVQKAYQDWLLEKLKDTD